MYTAHALVVLPCLGHKSRKNGKIYGDQVKKAASRQSYQHSTVHCFVCSISMQLRVPGRGYLPRARRRRGLPLLSKRPTIWRIAPATAADFAGPILYKHSTAIIISMIMANNVIMMIRNHSCSAPSCPSYYHRRCSYSFRRCCCSDCCCCCG